MTTLIIDDAAVEAQAGATLFEAASKAGIYIPALCTHPGVPPAKGLAAMARVYRDGRCLEGSQGGGFAGCRLCVVEVEGLGSVLACETPAQEGMVVRTSSARLSQMRRDRLVPFLASHPHTCIYCPYGEGCDLVECSFGTPAEERCCALFGNCELQRLAQYLGEIDDLGRYAAAGRPVVAGEPLILFNYELCVACLRCVAACRRMGSAALGYTLSDGAPAVGTVDGNLKASRCAFCGACIAVCPTAALADKSPKAKAVRAQKLTLPDRLMPARSPKLPLSADGLRLVPDTEGVYQLHDGQGEVLQIKGAEHLRAALAVVLAEPGDAVSFSFVEDVQYTSRENQLLQQFMQRHGRMPRLSLGLDDDLF